MALHLMGYDAVKHHPNRPNSRSHTFQFTFSFVCFGSAENDDDDDDDTDEHSSRMDAMLKVEHKTKI